MSEIGDTLQHSPNDLMFASESVNVKYLRPCPPMYQPSVNPTFQALAKLTNDIRNAMQEVERLGQ